MRSFKAVVSTGQFREKKRGPWQFVLQLQLVLWECLTSLPGVSAFLVQNLEAKREAGLPGTGLVFAGAGPPGHCSPVEQQSTSLCS